MALEAIEGFTPTESNLRTVDFGCADGVMLIAVANWAGMRFKGGTDLDLFRSGVPVGEPARNITYRKADLFRDYPFPLEDGAFDIAIASAFIKLHPEPARFLSEVGR